MGHHLNQGSRLKLLRIRAGIRPTQLARALGISTSLLSDWEDGRRPISDRQRECLIAAVNELNVGSGREVGDGGFA